MSTTNSIIAENIQRLRKSKKLSQKEVSISVGIPQGQYSLVENGKVMPTIPTLEKIANIELFQNLWQSSGIPKHIWKPHIMSRVAKFLLEVPFSIKELAD